MPWMIFATVIALRPSGIAGLFALLFMPPLVQTLFAANVTTAGGETAGWATLIAIMGWALYRPAESEAKLGVLRAFRLLLYVMLLVSILAFIVCLWSVGFRLTSMSWIEWLPGLAAVSLFALIRAFKHWVVRDNDRLERGVG